jgi:hypothetical protein
VSKRANRTLLPQRRKARTIKQVLGRDAVHPFPARMAPDLIADVLDALTPELHRNRARLARAKQKGKK